MPNPATRSYLLCSLLAGVIACAPVDPTRPARDDGTGGDGVAAGGTGGSRAPMAGRAGSAGGSAGATGGAAGSGAAAPDAGTGGATADAAPRGGAGGNGGSGQSSDAGAEPSKPPAGAAALEVATGEKIVNDCFVLAKVAGTDVTLQGAATVAKGATLLLWQVQDRFAKSGDQADLAAAADLKDAGTWELAAVESATAAGETTTVKVVAAPKIAYSTAVASGRAAQACVVPAYTDVTVAMGAKIVARAWNGQTGGVVAFTASGTLTVNGEISTTGLGFRGGPWTKEHFHADNDASKRRLTDLDTTSGFGGYKGEGLDGGEYPKREGRGNVANGAGGGNNTHAGGGGGGGAAKGGFGGMQHGFYGAGEPNTRGMGGVGVKPAVRDRVTMGGGGGQGQQVINRIAPQHCMTKGFATKMEEMTRGGNGGGFVLITAKTIAGAGKISADGTRGGCAEYDGAGGGGAGGTVWLKAEGGDFSGMVTANGGLGGDNLNTNSRVGPGGGGGGGRVRADVGGAKPKVEAKGAKSGTHYRGGPGGGPTAPDAYGATAGADGVVEM